MSKPLFSKKIKCLKCEKNFKAKMQHGKRIYVDSSYDNYGQCERNQITEHYLLILIEGRFDKKLTQEEIRECVERVEVNGEELFIYLKDQHPIEIRENVHIY